jgi:hypothetical protein
VRSPESPTGTRNPHQERRPRSSSHQLRVADRTSTSAARLPVPEAEQSRKHRASDARHHVVERDHASYSDGQCDRVKHGPRVAVDVVATYALMLMPVPLSIRHSGISDGTCPRSTTPIGSHALAFSPLTSPELATQMLVSALEHPPD